MLGTVAYMSPEQVRGKEVGRAHRSVFLRGGALRDGDRQDAVRWRDLGRNLQRDSARRAAAPVAAQSRCLAGAGSIIDKALEKDRNLRYQSAADLRSDLQRLKRDTESTPLAAHSSRPAADARGRPGRRRQMPLLAAICVVLAASAGCGGAAGMCDRRATQIDSLAVLPFTNVGGDAKTDYLSDGITESLIDNLAHVPELKVKSRHSVFRYKGKDVDVQQVGKDLGVAALVSGRVVPHGDTIEVSAELTNVSDNTEIWGQHYSGPATNIIAMQQQIAGDIASKLRSDMSSTEKQQVTKQGTEIQKPTSCT